MVRSAGLAGTCAAFCAFVFVAACERASEAPGSERRTTRHDSDDGFLRAYALTHRFALGRPNAVTLTPAGDAVLLLRSGPRSFVQDLVEHDVAARRERVLLTADSILRGAEERLDREEAARRERSRQAARGIASFSLSEDGRRILVPLAGRLFVIERPSGRVRELRSDSGAPIDPRLSPDGRLVASVRRGDLYVADVETGVERRLTTGGSDDVTHGLAEFIAQEEMGRDRGYWWSPDSTQIAFERSDTSGVDRMWIADPAHPDREPDARRYPRPGRPNADVRLGIVAAAGGEPTWVVWDRARFPYLVSARWDRGAPLTLVLENRDQTAQEIRRVDPSSGHAQWLHTETDAAWLEIDPSVPRWLEDGSGFLWSSERDGAPGLELRGPTGAFVRALTASDLGYRELLDVDTEAGVAWIVASPDPTEAHVWRVRFDGREAPRRITTERGVHHATLSRDHRVLVRVSHTLAAGYAAPEIVRAADGVSLGSLRSVAERPPNRPRPELVVTRGEPSFRAVLLRPRTFDPRMRYPVLLSVYGGPGVNVVDTRRDSYALAQWMADRGFIVVSLDGRGTPGRGRAWDRPLRGRIGELPLGDQIAGLRAVARDRPELDMERVGIFGWSFGGYLAALGAMRRPDVFRAAVAGAPVSDWALYDTHYTERYLGLPERQPEAYRRSSLLTWAGGLRRPLLIVHGTADDNVLPVHSLELSNALFRAGRAHEVLLLAGLTHMVPDPVVVERLQRRIVDFFERHLGEPHHPPARSG